MVHVSQLKSAGLDRARQIIYTKGMEPEKPKPAPLQVDIDDAVARGTYANMALISHSETEFTLDFAFVQPHAPKAKVLTRVISSPVHAKRLLWALKDNLEKYEAHFGPLEVDPVGTAPAASLYQ